MNAITKFITRKLQNMSCRSLIPPQKKKKWLEFIKLLLKSYKFNLIQRGYFFFKYIYFFL